MYCIDNIKGLQQTYKHYRNYILLGVYKRGFIALACLSIVHLVDNLIHIITIRIISIRLFSMSCVLIMLLTYIIKVSTPVSFLLILELNTYNISALSLYLWLGFDLNNLRYNYYSSFTSSQSAYVLHNFTHTSKNYYRRSLIILIR